MPDQGNEVQEVFEQDDNQAQANEAQPQEATDMFGDLLNSIVDDTGNPKYADVATALNSIPNAQQHIKTLEEENARLREEQAKKDAAEAIRGKQEPQKAEAPLSEEVLFNVVEKVLSTKSREEQEKANLNTVTEQFSAVYGEKAKEKMKQLADENQVSLDFLKSMAKTSPSAVLKLSGINSDSGTSHRSTGTVNTESFSPSAPVEKPKSVMYGANSDDMRNMWKWAGSQVKT